MRKIKFRAWYNQSDEMLDWEDIKECVGSMDWDDFMIDCELMQYTGLLDKNGKEIYEGDILQPFDTSGNPLSSKTRYCIESNFETSCGCCSTIHGWEIGNLTKEEVIGNIFENPELLLQNR